MHVFFGSIEYAILQIRNLVMNYLIDVYAYQEHIWQISSNSYQV